MGDKCGSHDVLSEQIAETRIAIARVEETTKQIPQLVEDMQAIKGTISNMHGFAAGIAAAISLLVSLITLGLGFKGGFR